MATTIRMNPVREKLLAGKPSYGIMTFEMFTPGYAQAVASAGAEFAIFDMEHSGVGIDTIKAQTAFSRGTGLVPIVRVPSLHYHLVAPVLDAGAMGIMAPMVETAEQARNLVAWSRYRPEGVRGLGFGLAHDDYRHGDAVETMKAENDRTLTIALVETAVGIGNIDEIATVKGLDVIWLGHYDLTNTMGITAQFEAPAFLEAVDRLVAACRKNGLSAGFVAGTVDAARQWRARGFNCLCYGTDLSNLQGSLRTGIAALRSDG